MIQHISAMTFAVIPLSGHQSRSSEEYKDRREQLARRLVRQMRERWRAWRERRKESFENLRQEMERLPSPPASRVCQICHKQWFATREFYYVQTRTRGKRANTTVSQTCRLCLSDQRRTRRGHLSVLLPGRPTAPGSLGGNAGSSDPAFFFSPAVVDSPPTLTGRATAVDFITPD